jgi:hypothetical protein
MWSSVKKLIDPQSAKTFFSLHGTRKFINMLTKARLLSLSYTT